MIPTEYRNRFVCFISPTIQAPPAPVAPLTMDQTIMPVQQPIGQKPGPKPQTSTFLGSSAVPSPSKSQSGASALWPVAPANATAGPKTLLGQ